MTKKSKMTLALASMLGITAGATAVSGFAWFTTTKAATVDITNIGVYSKSSNLDVQFTAPVKGCVDNNSDVGDVNVLASAAKTKNFTGDGTTKNFTLDFEPYAAPTATVDAVDTAVTWTSGRTISFATAPTNGAAIVVSYNTHSVLTDVSSVNGQNFYKPVWTAGDEGLYATSITTNPDVEGYLSFTMTLTCDGNSDLKVYLNNPSITGVDEDNNDADAAAADITRVALVEDSTHYLILQRGSVATNNLGIDSDFVTTGPTHSGLFDMSTLDATVDSTKFAIPDTSDKSVLSTAPDMTAARNYVTTVPAGGSKVITVTVWLEGTSYINGYSAATNKGGYAADHDPENGMINVSLPLIAF